MLKSRDRTYDEFCEKEELGGITFYLRTETSKRTKAATRQEQTKRTSQILGVKLLMMW